MKTQEISCNSALTTVGGSVGRRFSRKVIVIDVHNCKCDPNAINPIQQEAVLKRMCLHEDIQLLRILIPYKKNGPPNTKILDYACQRCSVEIIELLLTYGAVPGEKSFSIIENHYDIKRGIQILELFQRFEFKKNQDEYQEAYEGLRRRMVDFEMDRERRNTMSSDDDEY
jgi:hypothetical protein